MKFLYLFLLLFGFTVKNNVVSAHEYFFSFAEITFNQVNKQFEITIEASAHDVEDVMNESGIPIKELEDHYSDTSMIQKIEAFICQGFSIKNNQKNVILHLIGYEVKANGLVNFYFSSEKVDLAPALTFRYDWLMKTLPQQQNKITFKHNNTTKTMVFLPSKTTETIKLTL